MHNSLGSPNKLYLRLLEETSPSGICLSEQQLQHNKTRLLEMIASIPLTAKKARGKTQVGSTDNSVINTAEEIFKILNSQEFSYLPRKELLRHRSPIIGISLDKTINYCVKFQSLINLLGMTEFVRLYILSNHWAWTKQPPNQSTLRKDLDEVLSYSENSSHRSNNKPNLEHIKKQIDYYMEISRSWEKIINALIINEVHLLQKSIKLPIFRSFPGSDANIQSGEVGAIIEDNVFAYELITTKNYNNYQQYLIAVTYNEIIGYIEELSFRESYISYQIDFSYHQTGTYIN
ncbi:MAG: hypothetical protein IT292_09180 [Deltaproteobacteria bacterium]|nr:hypothetical protein [Deltaproteobacteria bacterium]